MKDPLSATVADAIRPTSSEVQWAISVHCDGIPVVAINHGALLRTASMGKVFLLAEVARRMESGDLDAGVILDAAGIEPVKDSGLWQHFTDVPLTVSAAAVLVAAVSDNLATNALLAQVGLASVQEMSASLGMPDSRILDRIRDHRTADDPSDPSVGRSHDLARFMHLLGAADQSADGWLTQVRRWLALGVDLSMVASALSLDPLAHAAVPPGLFNKTGADFGVRADAGFLTVAEQQWSYAVIANWRTTGDVGGDAAMAAVVLVTMRRIGEALWASANSRSRHGNSAEVSGGCDRLH
jgi:beta-lactamase class A